MDDLIWIGNTLYPRWFVMAIPAAVFIAPFLVVWAWRAIRSQRECQ